MLWMLIKNAFVTLVAENDPTVSEDLHRIGPGDEDILQGCA
jgi:hypothetical protein